MLRIQDTSARRSARVDAALAIEIALQNVRAPPLSRTSAFPSGYVRASLRSRSEDGDFHSCRLRSTF